MDPHPDLLAWRSLQKKFRDEEALARYNAYAFASSRRVHGLVQQQNAVHKGMPRVMQTLTKFYLGDSRVALRTANVHKPEPYAEEGMSSLSNGVLDMGRWNTGVGNDQPEKEIAIHSGYAAKYKEQFAKAPEIPPQPPNQSGQDICCIHRMLLQTRLR
jgi:hypothetical protein